MKRRARNAAGLTLAELVVSAALASVVAIGANVLLDTSGRLAQSSNDLGAASRRIDAALAEVADAVRCGSLASMLHLDGTSFAAGTSDAGIEVRAVTGWRGVQLTAAPVRYRWDVPPGGSEGDIIRADGAFEVVLASHVTDFRISRAGETFTITVAARSGPQDDRGRAARGSLAVIARNP